MIRPISVIALAAALLLVACNGEGESGSAGEGGSPTIRADEGCALQGLQPAIRRTDIVVDVSGVVRATPEEFRARNPELFKLILGLADPQLAVESGAVAPRERIRILAVSPRTGAVSPIFEGCVPGATSAELEQRRGNGAQKYFGSDVASRLDKQRGQFTRMLTLSLASLGKLSEPPAPIADGGFETSPLAKLLRPLSTAQPDEAVVRRLFVYSSLARSLPADTADPAAARKAGFDAAAKLGLNLGNADLYLVSARAPEPAAAQFLQTLVLGSRGRLLGVGGVSPSALEPAPARVLLYRGTLALGPGYEVPMTLRLASTAQGRLVSSWVTYNASFGARATPVTGEFVCAAERECTLKSDPAGPLFQVWRLTTGEQPEFRDDAPLGGLRLMEASERERGVEGRIYDPDISVGRPGGGVTFKAQRVKG